MKQRYAETALSTQQVMQIVRASAVEVGGPQSMLEHNKWSVAPDRLLRATQDLELGALDVDFDERHAVTRIDQVVERILSHGNGRVVLVWAVVASLDEPAVS